MSNVSAERVIEVLKEVFDPEMPVDVYNFGLVYDVQVSDDDDVRIQMTLTSESCPSARQIPEDIKKKVLQLPGARSCDVEVVWDPRWTPQRITAQGRELLGLDEE